MSPTLEIRGVYKTAYKATYRGRGWSVRTSCWMSLKPVCGKHVPPVRITEELFEELIKAGAKVLEGR